MSVVCLLCSEYYWVRWSVALIGLIEFCESAWVSREPDIGYESLREKWKYNWNKSPLGASAFNQTRKTIHVILPDAIYVWSRFPPSLSFYLSFSPSLFLSHTQIFSAANAIVRAVFFLLWIDFYPSVASIEPIRYLVYFMLLLLLFFSCFYIWLIEAWWSFQSFEMNVIGTDRNWAKIRTLEAERNIFHL